MASRADIERMLREVQRKQQQAIDEYNRRTRRAVDEVNRNIAAHNRAVQQQQQERKRAIEQFNRQVNAHNQEVTRQRTEQKKAIENYNRAVRAHNAQVRSNEQRRQAALAQLKRNVSTPSFQTFRSSVVALDGAYSRLEQRVANESSDANDDLILGMPGRENANSLEVMNALLEEGPVASVSPDSLQKSELENELYRVSPDLDQRWRGALFALSPKNPDAARHFCTSAREIITQILHLKAPDADVVKSNPAYHRAKDGRPTRRARVQYILQRRGINTDELSDFVEADIENVIGLFDVFNSATHGAAGKYEMTKLLGIKKRVEGGILFLSRLVH